MEVLETRPTKKERIKEIGEEAGDLGSHSQRTRVLMNRPWTLDRLQVM